MKKILEIFSKKTNLSLSAFSSSKTNLPQFLSNSYELKLSEFYKILTEIYLEKKKYLELSGKTRIFWKPLFVEAFLILDNNHPELSKIPLNIPTINIRRKVSKLAKVMHPGSSVQSKILDEKSYKVKTDKFYEIIVDLYLSYKIKSTKIFWKPLIDEALASLSERYPYLSEISFELNSNTVKNKVLKLAKSKNLDLFPSTKIKKIDIELQSELTFRQHLPSDWTMKNSLILERYFQFMCISSVLGLFINDKLTMFTANNKIFYPTKYSVIEFRWGEFLKYARKVLGKKSFTESFLKVIQCNFFELFLAPRFSYAYKLADRNIKYKNVLVTNAFGTNFISVDFFGGELNDSHYLGLSLLDKNIKVILKFYEDGSNDLVEKNKRNLDIQIFLQPLFAEVIKLLKIKNEAGFSRNIVTGFCISVVEMRMLSFGVEGFVYQAAIFPLERFSSLFLRESSFKKSNFKHLLNIAKKMSQVFEYLGIGIVHFPTLEQVNSKSFIFVELNPTFFNNFSFKEKRETNKAYFDKNNLYYLINYNAEADSLTSSEVITKTSIYDFFEEARKKGAKMENIVTKVLSLIKPTPKQEKISCKNPFGITFTKKIAYFPENSVYFSVLPPISLTEQLANIIMYYKSAFNNPHMHPFFDKSFLGAISEPFLNELLYNHYLELQSQFLNATNLYYAQLEVLYSSNSYFQEVHLSYFFSKLKKEIDLYSNNIHVRSLTNTSSILKWLKNKKIFFEGFFPRGYRFSRLKENLTKFDYSRIEEIRKVKDNFSGSIISLNRVFRKSFQANLGFQLLRGAGGNISRTIDIDAKGMHANIALKFCSNKRRYQSKGVDWDEIYNDFYAHLQTIDKSFSHNLLQDVGLNRDGIKKHLLAILNGRSINVSYEKLPDFKKQKALAIEKYRLTTEKYLLLMNSAKKYLNGSDFVRCALEATENISNMTIFYGQFFPLEFTVKRKVNYVFQVYESLLTMALIYDLINCGIIIHSIERDGVVAFANDYQLFNLQFSQYKFVHQSVFGDVPISLSCNLLMNQDEKLPELFSQSIIKKNESFTTVESFRKLAEKFNESSYVESS